MLNKSRAGVLQKSDEGYELTWAVNVMAPFLLTSLLVDNVKSRIVNVSSISAGSSIDFHNLQQVCKASALTSAIHILRMLTIQPLQRLTGDKSAVTGYACTFTCP